jgi:outer membrane protein TolC
MAQGIRFAKRAELESRLKQLEARRRDLRWSAELEVLQLRATFATAVESIEVEAAAVEKAQRIFAEYELQYEAGRRSLSDLLQAEADLRDARTASELAGIAVVRTWLQLRFAEGDTVALP